jgi:hypothetical protein
MYVSLVLKLSAIQIRKKTQIGNFYESGAEYVRYIYIRYLRKHLNCKSIQREKYV